MGKKVYYYDIVMDYRTTVEELISGGNVNVMVTPERANLLTSIPPIMSRDRERFLQETSITIMGFNKKIGTRSVIEKIKAMRLRPADIFHLLTLNRTYPASPGIKKEYALQGMHIVALGTLLPNKHDKRLLQGVNLTPILECEDSPRDPLKRRELRLNLTEYVCDWDGRVEKSDDWWPAGTQFACTPLD